MIVTEVAEIIKLDQIMDVSVDVHKEDLFSLARVPGKEYAKALTIVMRHFLRKFYGWYRSEQEFDKERFFVCQGDYKKVA